MNRSMMILTLGLATIALTITVAHPAPTGTCAPRALVLERLASQFDETRQSIGLAANNQVLETFASEAGSWTITVTLPNGMSCIIAAGENYETLVEPMPPEGSPT